LHAQNWLKIKTSYLFFLTLTWLRGGFSPLCLHPCFPVILISMLNFAEYETSDPDMN